MLMNSDIFVYMNGAKILKTFQKRNLSAENVKQMILRQLSCFQKIPSEKMQKLAHRQSFITNSSRRNGEFRSRQ